MIANANLPKLLEDLRLIKGTNCVLPFVEENTIIIDIDKTAFSEHYGINFFVSRVKDIVKFYNFDLHNIETVASKQLMLSLNLAKLRSYEEFQDTILRDIAYLYGKFENGDCDPNISEINALNNCLAEIERVRNKIKTIYDKHHNQ